MTLHLNTPQSAKSWCETQRSSGKSLGFVATMGALHDGHLSLLERSVNENDATCASIFVNPLQFNNPQDLKRYPRNLNKDLEMLDSISCDMLFTGEFTDFFPDANSIHDVALLNPGSEAEGLEGEHRPGHFAGVKTIVDKLFRTVGDCNTYFGEKDFQQTLVIKRLASEVGYPIVVVCPTIRESNGLAMSSRNQLLTDEQKQRSAIIYNSLLAARSTWSKGERDANVLRKVMMQNLSKEQLLIEYADVRDPENWSAQSPIGSMKRAQALIAVLIDNVRLIDNMRLDSV